jgi:hypothetical protein
MRGWYSLKTQTYEAGLVTYEINGGLRELASGAGGAGEAGAGVD